MKLYKGLILTIGATLFSTGVLAQEQHIIGSSGSYAKTSNYSIAWTVGECVITTSSSGSHELTQGFHQPDLYVVNVEEYLSNVEISVFPNPARNNVNITTSEEMDMILYDIQGKKIQSMKLSAMTSTIDVSYLSRGTYTLVFTSNGKVAKRMKIVIL